MVRFATLAVLFLSASVIARPTHRRRAVCKTSSPAVESNEPEPENKNVEIPEPEPESNKMKKVTVTVTRTSSSVAAKQTGKSTEDDDVDESKDAQAETGNGGAPSGNSGAVSALFPAGSGRNSWSLASGGGAARKAVSLRSGVFNERKKAGTSRETYVEFQGKNAMRVPAPRGCLTPGSSPACGVSYYTPGIRGADLDLSQAKEITFSYSVWFDAGFDFNLGGKMPGPYGGASNVAETCSGGRKNPRCWSSRLMFRPNGDGELYLYLPPGVNSNDNKCGRAAKSRCSGAYGASAGRGTWKWATGRWQTISQRLKLNDVGRPNGEAEIFYNGKSVLLVDNITWMTTPEAVIRGLQMQFFFGGHTDPWRSPKNQNVYFADFSVAVLR